MSDELKNFVLSSVFMLLWLILIDVRSFTSIRQKNSRNRLLMLSGATTGYIILNTLFIAIFLTYLDKPDASLIVPWKIVAFLFHIAYVFLPFAYYLFTLNFVKCALGPVWRKFEILPLVFLLILILITPFTGTLYTISASNPYGHARGPWFMFFSILNLFYYVNPSINLLAFVVRRKTKEAPYLFQSTFVSLVSLFGAIVNIFINFGDQFPFYPFCSVIGVMISFFFIASKDSDRLKDIQQQSIEKALIQAEEASNIKTTFLSNMSHDIRTPMNAIINLTDLALKESDVEVIHGYLEKLKISNEFLLSLVNDVLDMSHIETGNFQLHYENLTRTEFLKTVDTIISPLMKSKHINYHEELNPGKYVISVDITRFNQIFFNLLSNAVKYTPEGGDIWFEVENIKESDNKLKISFTVRDNGVGMSEEFLNHIYEPFAREESDYNRKISGTGLGLSIVKGLVDKLGGTISVKSKLGEGTEFKVLFDVDIVSKENELVQEQPKSDDEAESIKELKILLVEDNNLNAFVAKTILLNSGAIVTVAQNGKEAVEQFTRTKPFSFDVILMDIRMPVMNGIDALKAIRNSEHADAKTIPIIAVTADVFENEQTNFSEYGFSGYLSKPINANKVYSILKNCLTKHTPKNKT